MKLGCVTYNILKDWDNDTIIKNLAATGFEAVELRTSHKHGVEPSLTAEERKAVAAKYAASKVRLLSFGSTCEFQAAEDDVRRKNVDECKTFIDLAHDTGAWGVKVRPNGLPKGDKEFTPALAGRIGECLKELGNYGAGKGVEIWVEVHGSVTQNPPNAAAIMKATKHEMVGLCWNSNPTDVVNGSVRASWELLKPWVKSAHINELAGYPNFQYPYRELFALMRQSKYERYTLCESLESKEPERYLRWYKSLWTELTRG
jgi:hypothetical protein